MSPIVIPVGKKQYPETLLLLKEGIAQRKPSEALLANGSTQKFIADRYDTTQANLHNWLKKHGLKKSNLSISSE